MPLCAPPLSGSFPSSALAATILFISHMLLLLIAARCFAYALPITLYIAPFCGFPASKAPASPACSRATLPAAQLPAGDVSDTTARIDFDFGWAPVRHYLSRRRCWMMLADGFELRRGDDYGAPRYRAAAR